MKCVELNENELNEQINSLMERFDVVAPTYIDGVKDYTLLKTAEQLAMDDTLPYKSPKEAVLPRFEKLFLLDKNGIKLNDSVKKTLLFAAAPCDVAAIKILEKVFTGKNTRFRDEFFSARRDALIIVGKACETKKTGCFCDERGISREFSADCDAFMQRTDNGWRIQSLTEKGAMLFMGKRADDLTENAPLDETLRLTLGERELFSAVDWNMLTTGCQGCGVCTFVCPTCHCFEFRDSENNGVMTRSRVWDSCMFPKFTLHASGHNPRAGKAERFRQRVMHKYVYIRENFGVTACTGCGRCIRECPGGVSIRQAVKALKESEEKQ